MIQQIPKIRIGNTIHVGLAVMAGGQPRDLTGLVLTVVLVDNRGSKARINGWIITGEHNNVIRFTLQGFNQNNCGIYKVIVYENANKPNQAVVDSRLFELVRESAMEEGVDSGLIDKDVDLQIGGILIGGRDGTDGVGIASIVQTEASTASGGRNVWRVTLTNGNASNFILYNGNSGELTPEQREALIADIKAQIETETDVTWPQVQQYVQGAIGGLYTKPSGGIPKSDLSSEVQASLGKADTALQTFTESDPTVPSWAKQPSKPTYTASEVGALPDTTKYAGSQSAGGAANKAASLPTGVIDTENSVSTAYVASVDGITELKNGIIVLLYNESLRSASVGWTLNINGLGAKPVYLSQSNTRAADIMGGKSFYLFVFDTVKVAEGSWQLYTGLDTDKDTTAYRILRAWTTHYSSALMYREMILLTKSENRLLPVNSYNRNSATDKVLTSEEFDPFGQIWYYNGTTSIQADGSIAPQYLYDMFDLIDLRYSFNTGETLTERKDVFIVAVPQSNGKAKLAANPISQTLPSTEDGFIYIRLGQAFDTNRIALDIVKPIYYFKDGAIRQWTNQDTTALKLGTSTVGGTTQGVYLNQGVPAACESYDMWYMKHIAALYGATRNDATGLWSYYYKQCARWDDTQEKIVWDRNIGYDDITDAEMMDMCDHRLHSLEGVYGYARAMNSRIALHFIGYGNNQGAAQPCAYIGNVHVVTYGYIGQKGGANGNSYFPWHLQDTFLVPNVKNVIGRSGPSGATVTAPAGSLLEYATVTFSANNQTLNFGTCPNIEFVSIMYTLTNGGGINRTGCTLILHPDVYAKIFDSTNADYALWHKIDLANQARTNPITIQSA